jgi:hypothetical protein
VRGARGASVQGESEPVSLCHHRPAPGRAAQFSRPALLPETSLSLEARSGEDGQRGHRLGQMMALDLGRDLDRSSEAGA